jgi:hypothetical protein
MSNNSFPIGAIKKRKKELELETPEGLKKVYPLYPTVRREEKEGKVFFSTLVRKRYDGQYHLIPMEYSGETEAKTIHGIHAMVHRYLMLGVLTKQDVIDNDQINEATRLKNIK